MKEYLAVYLDDLDDVKKTTITILVMFKYLIFYYWKTNIYGCGEFINSMNNYFTTIVFGINKISGER